MSKPKRAIERVASNPSSPKPNVEQQAPGSTKSNADTELIKQIREFTAFSGPLPPPQILESYNKIIPNSAERLLTMVELQSEHRRLCEVKSLDAQIAITTRGQILAFVLSILGFGSALFCAYLGESTTASILGGGTLLGLASIFIKGYREKKSESVESKK